MLQRNRQLRAQVNMLIDGALCCLALWLAHLLRARLIQDTFEPVRIIEPFSQFIWLWFLILPGAPLVLDSQGFYDLPLVPRRRDLGRVLLRSCVLLTIGIILAMFPLKLALARSVVVLFGGTSFALLLLRAAGARWFYQRHLSQGEGRLRFILVGDATENARSRRELLQHPEEGIEPVAELDLSTQKAEDLTPLLHQHSANGVIIQARHSQFGQIEEVVGLCELEGVEVWLVADFFKTRISRKSFDYFQGRPTLVFRSTPEASWMRLGKEVLDFIGAILLLVSAAPVLFLAALLIKLTSPGPILFRQQRSGLNGRPFTMLKFRTMVSDAEQRQHELERLNEMTGPVFKVTHDPRVTPVGRYLRKFSIDEFPQLLNVLGGQMSLVGPRPLPVDQVRRISDLAHRRRLSVKPGLTCLWQVRGRSEVSNFNEWVRMDLEYIDHWSLWLDLAILFRTIPVVLLGKGAK
jgi:exopolysaccharide biosynthesis polyprenyl glycosylphosphotransferase